MVQEQNKKIRKMNLISGRRTIALLAFLLNIDDKTVNL